MILSVWRFRYLRENKGSSHKNCASIRIMSRKRVLPRSLVDQESPSYANDKEPGLKTFTIDEAQSLLPLLESLLKRASEGKRAAQEIESELTELGRRIYLAGGMRVNLAETGRKRTEMEAHLQRVQESIAEIDSIGVQVKDVEAGLLDFPCRVDDQVVLLCWRMGETSIEHWHTIEDGFQGRKPVDERFRRRSNSSNNRPN